MAETNDQRTAPRGGGTNWLTQEEIDAAQRELDMSKARDQVWEKIILGLIAIYLIGVFYDVFAGYLP